MRKLLYISILLLFTSCAWRDHSVLENMGAAFRQHVKYNDEKNNIKTNIHTIKPLSYDVIPVSERDESTDYYLCKIYFAATWSYMVGNRIYNTNDTVNCIFNKDKQFVRVKKAE